MRFFGPGPGNAYEPFFHLFSHRKLLLVMDVVKVVKSFPIQSFGSMKRNKVKVLEIVDA